MLNMCDRLRMPYRIKRYIPNDDRRINYTVAEQLLNAAYYAQITGYPSQSMHWAGMHLHSLKDSVATIHLMEQLNPLRHVTPAIEKEIVGILNRMKL